MNRERLKEMIVAKFTELADNNDGCWWEVPNTPQRERHFGHLAEAAISVMPTIAGDKMIDRVAVGIYEAGQRLLWEESEAGQSDDQFQPGAWDLVEAKDQDAYRYEALAILEIVDARILRLEDDLVGWKRSTGLAEREIERLRKENELSQAVIADLRKLMPPAWQAIIDAQLEEKSDG